MTKPSTIGNDRTEMVGNNETITIGNNRTETVGANESITVAQNRTRNVGQNEVVSVALTRTHNVGVNEMINVGAAQEVTVGAVQTVTVGAAQMVTVGATQTVTVDGDRTINARAKLATEVGTDEWRQVNGTRETTVVQDDTLYVGKNLVIVAGKSVTIQTEEASITMLADGTIEINGGTSRSWPPRVRKSRPRQARSSWRADKSSRSRRPSSSSTDGQDCGARQWVQAGRAGCRRDIANLERARESAVDMTHHALKDNRHAQQVSGNAGHPERVHRPERQSAPGRQHDRPGDGLSAQGAGGDGRRLGLGPVPGVRRALHGRADVRHGDHAQPAGADGDRPRRASSSAGRRPWRRCRRCATT